MRQVAGPLIVTFASTAEPPYARIVPTDGANAATTAGDTTNALDTDLSICTNRAVEPTGSLALPCIATLHDLCSRIPYDQEDRCVPITGDSKHTLIFWPL